MDRQQPTFVTLDELVRRPRGREEIGGKALGLVRLKGAGLPVPDTAVLTAAQATRRLSEEARSAIVARLGDRLAVRSSAAIEDTESSIAAGVFDSVIGVAPAQLEQAIARVIASGSGPVARTYLERKGMGEKETPHDNDNAAHDNDNQHGVGGGVPMAVVVQRVVGDERAPRGVLYTRPPMTGDDEVWIEVLGTADEVVSRVIGARRAGSEKRTTGARVLTDEQVERLVTAGIAAEDAIGAAHGADVEWVLEGETLWLVQARPQVRGRAPTLDADLKAAFAFTRDDPRIWRWDASHNPDPLSPAQAGLVAAVADLAPYEMAVVEGHLYTAPRSFAGVGASLGAGDDGTSERSRSSDEPSEANQNQGTTMPGGATPSANTRARELLELFNDVAARIERVLRPVEDDNPPELDAALAAYRAVFAIYTGELSPALATARASLAQSDRHTDARSRDTAQHARRLAHQPSWAPAWDVAAPTFGETHPGVSSSTRDMRDHLGPPSIDAAQAAALVGDLATLIEQLGERDDSWFFRAQHLVRRAILGLAARWQLTPAEQLFSVPLAYLQQHADRGQRPDPQAVAALARAAVATRRAQRDRRMPLTVQGGEALWSQSALPSAKGIYRGLGVSGGRARGPVVVMGDLGTLASADGKVVLARTVTPATITQLTGALALVCEQGGALHHAATLARDLGLPCVVGCEGGWRSLRDGDPVLVDGDAGIVVQLSEARSAYVTDGRSDQP